MRASLHAALLFVALPIAAAPPPAPPAEERPFPVDRTQILSDEKVVYTVEGRVRIPKGVEITCQKDVHVKAKGSAPAIIEVEGSLKVHGVGDREVIFEKVFVEPQKTFKSIFLDMCWFRDGGGVRTPEGVAVSGDLFLEHCDHSKGAGFEVVVEQGEVKMSSICSDGPTRIRVVRPPDAKSDRVQVFLRGSGDGGICKNHSSRRGFGGGLEVDGGEDVTIQLSRTGGALTAVRNWGKRLIFDGMKVNSETLEFSHRDAGKFAAVQCAKLDIYAGKVVAKAPLAKGVKDVLTMDRCWFNGIEDPKKVFADVIQDNADDPENNGVHVQLPKINARPLELAGAMDR